MKLTKTYYLILLACTVSCGHFEPVEKEEFPPIWPDSTEVTIPANIAPMNFGPADSVNACRISVTVSDENGRTVLKSKGSVARFPLHKWHRMLRDASGSHLSFLVEMKTADGWTRYKPFHMNVSSDPIDYGLTYRLIPPGYQSFGHMGLFERDLSCFRQKELLDTRILESGCINCHTENRTDPETYSFHVRGKHSATVIRNQGITECLNTKTDSTGGFFVYQYWHPSGRYSAYSVNGTRQSFYASHEKMLEVYDENSDIIVYHPETHTIIRPEQTNRQNRFETWPAFSADGRTLFFCVSPFGRLPRDAKEMKYSLCGLSFNPDDGSFGQKADTLLDASRMDLSFAQPRPSYDGKYILVTAARFGTFLIWHKEADLWLYNLETGEFYPAGGINSNDTESFHNWSSNSKWAVVASRRDDGLYTRLYLAHLNEQGVFDKAFLLPQKNPGRYYAEQMHSYNTPDFTSGKVKIDRYDIRRMVMSPERKSVTLETNNL